MKINNKKKNYMKYLKHFANAQEAQTILATWPFNTISSIQGQEGVRFSEGVPVGPVVPTDRIILKFMVTAEDWNEDAGKYRKQLIGEKSGSTFYDGSCFAYMIKDNERIDRKFWSQFIYFDTIGEHTVELIFDEEFDGSLPRNCLRGSEMSEVVISNNVTSIGNSAFSGCTGLASVTISSGVTFIDNYAFENCSGLTSVIIPDGVTSIGSKVFWSCSGLTSVTIGSGVTSIGKSAFQGCTGLTSVTIPDGVTSIGESAFYACSGLTSVTIGSGVTSIGKSAFQGCTDLTSVTIPDGVTSIGEGAFQSCNGLTSVTIGSGVTSIGKSAFLWCSGLTSVTIPDGVTSIGESAFYACSGLTSVTIGSGVTSIGNYAFSDCSGLTSVTCLRETPPTLNSSSFNNTNSCPIYVPASSVDAYKAAAGWSGHASRIQAIQ